MIQGTHTTSNDFDTTFTAMLIRSSLKQSFYSTCSHRHKTSSVDTLYIRHKNLVFWIEQVKTRCLSAYDCICHEKYEF